MTRSSRSPVRRRGAILLVVITLIALFSVVALSFVLYAESEATAARIHREAADDPAGGSGENLPYTEDAGLFATQLLYGGTGDPNDFLSGLYGNDLGRTRFVSNTGTPINVPAAGRGVPQFPSNANSANPIPFPIGAQLGVYAGLGGPSAVDDANALGLTTPQPLAVNGVGVPRQDVAYYGPMRDANGILSVLPEYTGYQRFGGAWAPVTATGGAYTGTQAPQFVSRAAAYTYPDVNNFFLAQVRADTGELVTPSFHRRYVFDRRLTGVNGTPPFLTHEAFNLDLHPANPNWYTVSGRLRIARPRPWDQLTPGEQAAVAGAAGIGLPIPENLTPAQANNLFQNLLQAQRTGVIGSPVLAFPTANPDGTVTGDVRNYQTTGASQRADSVWLYLGSRPVAWRGRKVVPMVSAMILDLSARANLNTATNSTSLTTVSYKQTMGGVTEWRKFNASHSSLGVGPHEINVSHLLRGVGDTLVPSGNPVPTGQDPNSPLTWPTPDGPPGMRFGEVSRAARDKPMLDRLTGQLMRTLNGGRPAPLYSPFDLNASLEPAANPATPPTSGNFVIPPGTQLLPPAYPPTAAAAPPFPNFAGLGGTGVPAAAALLFHPNQWPRAVSARPTGSGQQYGFEEMRRAASRLGVSPADGQRIAALTLLGGLLPNNLPVAGGPIPDGTGRFAANPGAVARALFTTYSTSSARPEVRIAAITGVPLAPQLARLGPIDINRPLGDYRVNDNPLSPQNTYPLGLVTAGNPLGSADGTLSNQEAYKRYAPARLSRQHLARDIYVRLAAVTLVNVEPDPMNPPIYQPVVDGTEVCYNPRTGYLHHFDIGSGSFQPLTMANVPTTVRLIRLRELAQVAANLVDLIDPDDISTLFVWNPPLYGAVPFQQPYSDPAAVAALNSPRPNAGTASPELPVDPTVNRAGFPEVSPPIGQFLDPSADPAVTTLPPVVDPIGSAPVLGDFAVFGTELPRVVLNEVLCAVVPNPTNPTGPYHKRYWVELHNPLPIETNPELTQFDPAAPEGGVARLRWLVDPAIELNGKPTYSPYRLEIAERNDDGTGSPLSVAEFLAGDATNVTGDLPASIVGPGGVLEAEPKIRLEDFNTAVAPTGADDLPQDMNVGGDPARNKRAMVRPIGRTGVQPGPDNGNRGFFVIGFGAGAPTDFPDPGAAPRMSSRRPDEPEFGALPPYPQAVDVMSLDTGLSPPLMGMNTRLDTDGTQARRRNVAILRRLAHPHMPPNYPGMTAPTAFDPALPVNSYLTVDLMDRIPTRDSVPTGPSRGMAGTPNPEPDGTPSSFGRLTPYAGAVQPTQPLFFDRFSPDPMMPTPVPVLPLTDRPPGLPHTLFNPNQLAPSGGVPYYNAGSTAVLDQSPWLTHFDREMVSPLELIHASRLRPFLLTAGFAVPHQTPLPAGAIQEPVPAVTWQPGRHALVGRLLTRPLSGEPVLPDYADWFRLLDLLTTRGRLPGMPVGGPEPGRVNVNGIWDDRADPAVPPPNQPPYAGTPEDPTPPGPAWQSPTTSRMLKAVLDPVDDPTTTVVRNWFSPTEVAYMWRTNPTVPAGPFGPDSRMLRSLEIGRLHPTQVEVPDAGLVGYQGSVSGVPEFYDKPFTGFASAPAGTDTEFTLLRSRGDGRPLFFLNSPPQPHTQVGVGNPTPPGTVAKDPPNRTGYEVGREAIGTEFPWYGQAEPLRKMLNSTTTTSDSFLVLLTVSYFEVRTDGNDNPLFDAQLTPAGLQRPLLGREAKREVPGDLRKQFVLVVDRSMLTALGTTPALPDPPVVPPEFNRPGAVPWFTALAADAAAGENVIVVSAGREQPQVPGSAPVVFVNGTPTRILPGANTVLRLGFGDANPAPVGDGNDGEPVLVTAFDQVPMTETEVQSAIGFHQSRFGVPLTAGQARQQYSSGRYVFQLAAPLTRNHATGGPVSNALHAHPGPRSPLDLRQPESKGVVPFMADVPKPQ